MIAIINNHEFQLHESNPYQITPDLIILNILTDSVDELVEIIGDDASVIVKDEFIENSLVLDKITRFWESGRPVCEVIFSGLPVNKTLKEHSDDIETIAQAIQELAEIIGGDE